MDRNTQNVEHDSLEMNGNGLNIHGNMLEWLETQLNIHQFKLQIHEQANGTQGSIIMLAKDFYRY